MIKDGVLRDHVAAVSCGLYKGTPVLDLDYAEDFGCRRRRQLRHDRHRAASSRCRARPRPCRSSQEGFDQLMALARKGIAELISLQKLTVDVTRAMTRAA